MRLTYPGITKLVVVKSVYNDTPAGRAAIDVVARYFGGLSSATQRRSIAAESRLASKGCAQCQKDLTRIQGYIDKNERVVYQDRAADFKSVAIFISRVTPSGIVFLQFDGANPAVRLVDAQGRTIGAQAASVLSAEAYVDTQARQPAMIHLSIG